MRPRGRDINSHDVNPIIGIPGPPRVSDRRFTLAANAGIPAVSLASMCRRIRDYEISMVQARVGLAAYCVIRCGPLQRMLKDG